MNRTGIEWCDFTWNPIVGCSPVSAGCAHCYAARIAQRFDLSWGKPVFYPSRLDQVWHRRKPSRIFVGSMTDLGHPGVHPVWRDMIVRQMSANLQHTYIVLTKRPGPWLRAFGLYAWIGVTVEDQAAADDRIPKLLEIDNTDRRFVSCEPLLGPVDLLTPSFIGSESFSAMGRIRWVIAGPETGPGARSCLPEWIQQISADCALADVPFFDKRGIIRREIP